ncbi:MAG: ATP synthase F0 subunit C [Candidatus Poribacteria bacterium]|nr:ATP synthase F0 subunit C [Candidatus Poribacteria bacterium]
MIYLAVLAFGVTLGLPIAVIFASTAQGKATSTALEGIARQPESSGKIQTAMIIGLALIESLVIYALLMFFILQAKLPADEMLRGMIDADAGNAPVEQVQEDAANGNGVEMEDAGENQ